MLHGKFEHAEFHLLLIFVTESQLNDGFQDWFPRSRSTCLTLSPPWEGFWVSYSVQNSRSWCYYFNINYIWPIYLSLWSPTTILGLFMNFLTTNVISFAFWHLTDLAKRTQQGNENAKVSPVSLQIVSHMLENIFFSFCSTPIMYWQEQIIFAHSSMDDWKEAHIVYIVQSFMQTSAADLYLKFVTFNGFQRH